MGVLGGPGRQSSVSAGLGPSCPWGSWEGNALSWLVLVIPGGGRPGFSLLAWGSLGDQGGRALSRLALVLPALGVTGKATLCRGWSWLFPGGTPGGILLAYTVLIGRDDMGPPSFRPDWLDQGNLAVLTIGLCWSGGKYAAPRVPTIGQHYGCGGPGCQDLERDPSLLGGIASLIQQSILHYTRLIGEYLP